MTEIIETVVIPGREVNAGDAFALAAKPVAKAAGVDDCGGCNGRQAALNRNNLANKAARVIDRWTGGMLSVAIERREREGAWKWAVGIITSPRPTEPSGQQAQYLTRCLTSLQNGGWDLAAEVTVFAEPGSPYVQDVPMVVHAETKGNWGNWFYAARYLAETYPDAHAYLIGEDDGVCCKRVRKWFEKQGWPKPVDECGYVSLYTASNQHATIEGWWQPFVATGLNRGLLWGAVATVWPPDLLKQLVNTPILHTMRNGSTEEADNRLTDFAVHITKRPPWLVRRSLWQHIGQRSSLHVKDPPASGWRAADTFVGEDFDVYLETTPLEPLPPPEERLGKDSTTVPPELWAAISERLKPGMRTLELGSGVTTALFERAGCRHVAIEDQVQFIDSGLKSVHYSPLAADGGYAWLPAGPFDLVLVDGPSNPAGRLAMADRLLPLVAPGGVMFLDDCHRAEESELGMRLLAMPGTRGGGVHRVPSQWGERAFAIVERGLT